MGKTKRFLVLLVLFCVIFLCACSPLEVLKQQRPQTAEPVSPMEPSPPLQISPEFYQSELPYLPNQTRGALQQTGSRMDAAHVEWGMLEYAKASFPTDQHLFREGQLITGKELQPWRESHPELINILEHNYLNIDTKELAGIVLSISLNPRHKDETGATISYKDEELNIKGEMIAKEISSFLHNTETNIPLFYLLYRTEPASSMIPGRFIRWGHQLDQQKAIEWKNIRERFYLLPSEDIQREHPQIFEGFSNLQNHVQQSFPQYVGLIGLVRFLDDKPLELTIKAHTNDDSLTESIQFTQSIAQKLDKEFDRDIQMNLYLETIDRPLAVYIRPIKGESFLHVFPGVRP